MELDIFSKAIFKINPLNANWLLNSNPKSNCFYHSEVISPTKLISNPWSMGGGGGGWEGWAWVLRGIQ